MNVMMGRIAGRPISGRPVAITDIARLPLSAKRIVDQE